jgi:apolipoprotein N-acyltransferase
MAATGGWAAMELVRLRFPFGGFGWGLAGYPMGEYTLTRDATQFFGTTGWSVLVVGIAAGIVVWIRASERRPLAVAVASVAIVVAAGAIAPAVSDGEPVRVAIVQGSTPCPQQRCAGERAAIYATSLDLTRSIEAGSVDLVVWPEGSTGFSVDPVLDASIAAEMGAEAVRIGAVLLAGGDRPLSDTEWTNANVVFDTAGDIVGEYPKRHPVPFGEYVPFRPLFAWIPDLSRVPRDMIRGSDPVVFDEGFGPFGSVISFESAFSRYARNTVNEGARLLIVATSQASYPFSNASDQLIAMTRMRSAELGVDLIHSAITGRSTLITDGGIVGETTDLVTAEVLTGTVEMRQSGRTMYAVLGDWLALLAAIVLGGGALLRSAKAD